MSGLESTAAKMRQLTEEAGFVPGEASLALARVIATTNPWSDERTVARELRSWAGRYWGTGALEPGLADGAGQVAEQMRALGMLDVPPSEGEMLGIAFHMLRNVARRCEPTGYDLLRDHVRGVPERTLRRYRQRARGAGKDPINAFDDYMVSLQYDLDVGALVNRGRSPAAARRWLQRHPGRHAKDAPPPRPRHGEAF